MLGDNSRSKVAGVKLLNENGALQCLVTMLM